MEFRLEFFPKPFTQRISLQDKLFLAGSCFTEQIGAKLAAHKFQTIENPNGILFNPVSITKSLIGYMEAKQYTADDLFYQQELWGSWDHHTRFSALTAEACLQKINEAQHAAHAFLQQSNWLLLTLGSAFVYELGNKRIVANCHKVPTDKFAKRLLGIEEVITTLDGLIYRLRQFNPGTRIIFTVSPVRHLRDGFVENNRSKATLINAVHHLADKYDNIFYFPAYELVIDDLRDYRFYAEDMVHPNYAATNYVWEKFVPACVDEASQLLMKEINLLNAAKNHRPFNPESEAHKKFMATNLERVHRLAAAYPYLDFAAEQAYFQQ